MIGIYVIRNTNDDKKYIGSTTDFKRRWAYHRGCLIRGKHSNPHLQAAWNKYGEGAFEFAALEYLHGQEQLPVAEQFWVDIYKDAGKKLYNIAAPGKAPMLGRTHTSETCQKIREASKEHRHTEETRHKISMVSRGNQHALGHRLTEEVKRRLAKAAQGNKNNWGHKTSMEQRHKLSVANARLYPAFIHQETGEIIPAGLGLRAMCRERGLSQSSMRALSAGRQEYHKGWMLLV